MAGSISRNMTEPDVKQVNRDPRYLRLLVEAVQSKLDTSQPQVARSIDHNERTLRYWLRGKHEYQYPIQYILEEYIGRAAVERARAKYQELDK